MTRRRSRSITPPSSRAIDGRTGILSVKVGSLATANQTELTTIARVQPVFVTFSVPAVHLGTIKLHMTGDRLKVAATPQDADCGA